ncbi:hypothetical protein [uncultured Pontibacter sp.]|uniref:hypothetical protein n=1 Tax=uncultured Pontibacter sp. TaxID=453356 RepID=UPI00260BECE2|nr:hypothetical protein [uncultured Pontibacter sp.]
MIITSILTLIGLCGTLAIIAYLRQVEDAMAEVQEQLEVPVCPVCHIAHLPHEDKKMHTSSLRGIKSYCKRQRRAATRLYSARNLSHIGAQRREEIAA